jgi:simple sugar transport system permease protein
MSSAQTVLASGIALMAPVLWASLGELITEQAGLLNLGIEGVMIMAAFGCALAYQETGSPLAALAVAIVCGLLAAALLGVLYIRLNADQIVTGIVFGGAMTGLAAVLTERYLLDSHVSSIGTVSIPALSGLPWIGSVLFEQNALVYAAVLAIPCVYYLLHKTWFGLHARAAGERPLVDETAGISVRGIRAVALTLGCVLIAVGGATLVLSTSGTYTVGMTGGRGYIALAVVVLARWNPFAAALGALLFGLAQALQFDIGSIPLVSHLPQDIVLMIPYIVAATVVLFTRGSRYPEAVGTPYRPQAG